MSRRSTRETKLAPGRPLPAHLRADNVVPWLNQVRKYRTKNFIEGKLEYFNGNHRQAAKHFIEKKEGETIYSVSVKKPKSGWSKHAFYVQHEGLIRVVYDGNDEEGDPMALYPWFDTTMFLNEVKLQMRGVPHEQQLFISQPHDGAKGVEVIINNDRGGDCMDCAGILAATQGQVTKKGQKQPLINAILRA